MAVSLFLKKKASQRGGGGGLDDVLLRGFGGGLNLADEDTNMEPKYQTALENFRRTTSGSQVTRYGYGWFADVAGTVTGTIVDLTYFNNRLVVVTTTGQIVTLTDAGGKAKIWDATIAGALPGAPSGWSATTQVNFVPWKDQLIIHNGVDRPIIISAAFAVTYLQDLGTGSNVNVPIGKFGCIAANYHCVAGITGSLTTVYISSKGTSGTFPGDPAPNDAISIDVGAYAPSGAPEILGIAGYRTKLIVFFHGQSLIIRLGEYDDATTPNHVPAFDDEMPQFGLINHRCVTSIENDIVFSGYDGLASGKRNLFSGSIDSKYLSALVEPDWRGRFAQSTVSLPFLVYNKIDHMSLMFVNDPDGTVLVYQANTQLKFEAWTKFKALKFACGCKSFLGRVFMANRASGTTRIYQYGNNVFPGENYTADRVNDRDATWANSTVYTAGQLLVGDTIEIDGGFENDFTGWTIYTFNNGFIDFPSATINTVNPAHSGAKSAQVSNGLPGHVNIRSDAVIVRAGADYTLSGWFNGGVAGVSNSLTFGIEYYDESNVLISTEYTSTAASLAAGWSQKTHTGTAPARAHTGRVIIQCDASVFLCDDIKLTTTSALATVYKVLLNHTSPATGTLADDVVAHPTRFEQWLGDPIDFTFELPWVDGRTPMRVKHTKFISLDTRGTAQFLLSTYVDFNENTPAVSFSFVGNDATSGNRSNDPQLYGYPIKFKALKTKITGSSRNPLTIASIRYLFLKGRYRR